MTPTLLPDKRLFALFAFISLIVITPGWAIDHKYRDALEWSGCNQQNADIEDASGKIICNSHRSKAWNSAHQQAAPDLSQIKAVREAQRRDLETYVEKHILHKPKQSAFSALKAYGFSRGNDGDFFRMSDTGVDHIYMTFDQAQVVTTAVIK